MTENVFRFMNHYLALWMLIAILCGLPAHGCVSTRFYSLPFETLRCLDSRFTRETLKNPDQFTRLLNDAFGTRKMGPDSTMFTVIYDPKTSRLFAIGTISDYQRIDETIRKASFFRAAYSICLPVTALFIALWGFALCKNWRGQIRIYSDYPFLTRSEENEFVATGDRRYTA